MASLNRVGVLAFAMLLSGIGCSASKEAPKEVGPSYAELVIIYNAELETLDRLERKRKELITEYETQNRPPTQDAQAQEALKSLTNLIGSAGELNREMGATPPADPNAALDKAVSDAEKAQQVASQLLQSATQASESDAGSQPIVYSEEFQQQLAALDAEIEAQRQRADNARQARDAAEQKK